MPSPEVDSLLPFCLYCLLWQYNTPLTLNAVCGHLFRGRSVLVPYGYLFIISW